MIDGVRSRNPITCIRPPSPTAMHLLFTCEQPPPPTTMHQLYTIVNLNRPISTTHIQYQPNSIKYTAPKCSTLTVNRIVLTKVFCLTLHEPSADVWTECKQVVQVCAKYVLSMTVCKLWKCAKYESVRSMCKVCTNVWTKCKQVVQVWNVKRDHRLLIRQPLFLHTERIKKRHQKTKKPK